MGQNITAINKRKRRRAYLKRRKERLKELIKGAKQGKKEAPAK